MPTEPRYDLLSEHVIPVRFRDGSTRDLSLPGLLSALQGPGIESFPTLRPHQTHPWHAFLVQLAAMAIHRAGANTGAASTETWAERLLALTSGQREPWCLVVPDLSKPAFFQPPVPEGNLNKFNKWPGGTPFPDEIDMLVTAKNHDVKRRLIRKSRLSHWIFSLVTVQTTDGYAGKKTYGIIRMNGGYSNRPSIGYAPGIFPNDRFTRDLAVLLSSRDEIASELSYPKLGGHMLLWLLSWNGRETISITHCDPFFIEICRRIRLSPNRDQIVAFGASTDSERISSLEINGRTGDPWNAIRLGEPSASLTVKREGFSYRRIRDLISANSLAPGVALRVHETDSDTLWLIIATLVREKGKTAGYYERMIPVPGRIRKLLFSAEGRDLIGNLAGDRIEEVSEVQYRALKPAILALLQGANDDGAAPWLRQLDDEVDAIFFADLWDSIQREEDPDEALDAWAQTVFSLAEKILDEAIDSVPIPESRHFRAISAAQRIFYGRRKARLGNRKESNDAVVS